MKSAYVLELTSERASRCHMFLCSTFAHVRKLLEWELARVPEPCPLELLEAYHDLVGVQVIKGGKRMAKLVDLRVFMRLRVDGAKPVSLDDKEAIAMLRAKRSKTLRAEIEADWRGIEKALPKLQGDVAVPGQPLKFKHPGGEPDELQWGWNDQFGGEDAPDDFPVLD